MKNSSYPQVFVWVNALVPGAILAYDVLSHHAGPDPARHAIHVTGTMALICLGLSLSVTPARKITGLAWLFYLRRTLGLLGFFYALVHVTIYFKCEQDLDIGRTFGTIFKSPYLVWGLFAFTILLALALTLFKSSPRLLGNKNWQRLHRAVYAAAILSILHYWTQGKVVTPVHWGFAIAFGILLLYRVVAPFLKPRKPLQTRRLPVEKVAGRPG